MSEGKNLKPYKSLGEKLKAIRERSNETIAEVSGAVEIDALELANFEIGRSRPTQEILLLLISHFGIKDDEAIRLWELAGYKNDKLSQEGQTNILDTKQGVAVLPADARIVYTDMVHVMVNNYGVVMNFMQGAGPNMQPLAVSRIGMSHEHAISVLQVLKTTLEQSEVQQKHKNISPGDTN